MKLKITPLQEVVQQFKSDGKGMFDVLVIGIEESSSLYNPSAYPVYEEFEFLHTRHFAQLYPYKELIPEYPSEPFFSEQIYWVCISDIMNPIRAMFLYEIWYTILDKLQSDSKKSLAFRPFAYSLISLEGELNIIRDIFVKYQKERNVSLEDIEITALIHKSEYRKEEWSALQQSWTQALPQHE